MNRLEDMIARLFTQRAYIGAAAGMIAHLEGPVLEVDLGKGRTYSHLKQIFPDREIFAFDNDLHALPDVIPSDGYLLLGDFRDTLLAMADRQDRPAVLAHADTGSEDHAADAALARDIAGPLVDLVAAQGLGLSDRELPHRQLETIDPPKADRPSGIDPWPYFMYRVAKTR
jgi:hypothetical protein